jgi:hypothetical protein
LQLAGEGADQFDAGRDQDVGEEYADLGFAFGDGLRNLTGRGLHFDFRLHFLGDAEALEHLCDIGARSAGWQESYRRRREHRFLERF